MSDTTELVDLAVIFPDMEIELKYACADNITGKAIYQQARCLLHKDAITALAKSISIAQLSGLQLVIYDAYRPQQAQAMLWQACPDPQYVVDVAVGSNHSRGTAIDLTLRDEHGNILDMGAEFDEMHERFPCLSPFRPASCSAQSAVAECDYDWRWLCRYPERMVALRITPGSELPTTR